MALSYQLLGNEQAEHLRRQRLLDLEADHFRFVLDVEESGADGDLTAILAKINDVERRIKIHRKSLGLPEFVSSEEDTVEVPPEAS